jgi:protein-tyrosine phosphatase
MTPSDLLLPGTFNSRDLGGRQAAGGIVRTGVVMRSDAPLRLGEDGRRALAGLGLRTAIDLREPVERRLDPVDLEGLGLELRHEPILGEDFDVHTSMSLEEVYRALLERRSANLSAAVRVLSDPGAVPALFFCSAGKDRTGLVAALVLGALGVSEADIVADYARTERNMDGEFRSAIEARAIAAGISEQELAVKVGAPPALMRDLLAWLRERYGGVAGYLRHNGLTEVELESLRRRLVEPRAVEAA